jgi:epoxyqueuosine reductase
MNLSDEIKTFATGQGVDLVGIAPVDRFKYAPEKYKPQYYMKDATFVVVLASRILEGICDVHGAYNQEGKTIGPYAWYGYPIINWSISWAAIQAGKKLEDRGFKALPFPPTGFSYQSGDYQYPDFMHKHAAVAAGLGEFGFNRLLLTPQFGAHQRIVSIITNAPLVPDPMYSGARLCNRKECQDSCVNICPMKAFNKEKLTQVRIGDRTFEYMNLDSILCRWHTIAGKYLRGNEDLPRYPTRQEIDKIISASGGLDQLVQEKSNPVDRGFKQYTFTPTCGACQVKCRAPWGKAR